MRTLLICIILFVCALPSGRAQTNYVRNPSFERYDTCPYESNRLDFALHWHNIIDSTFWGATEYVNACTNTEALLKGLHVPDNTYFYQNAHSGRGMAVGNIYYDKTLPAPPNPPLPFNYRDYAQVRLQGNLTVGKSYCVTFYTNLAETSAYAHNKIGAYLDNGNINKLPLPPGSEVTAVSPQVYTNSVVDDTMNWTRIEGTFTANGDEVYITLGVFEKNANITAVHRSSPSDQYSYYLFDDVSVVESDLPAEAGADTWVEAGKTVQVGRVGDSTAEALDCQWYHKGSLIDSGAIISVPANATVGATDTYVVVQTICGLAKTDTVVVRTVPLGVTEWDVQHAVSIYPNPSPGIINIQSAGDLQSIRVFDLSGRVVAQQTNLKGNNTTLNLPPGMYIVEVQTTDGVTERQRVLVE